MVDNRFFRIYINYNHFHIIIIVLKAYTILSTLAALFIIIYTIPNFNPVAVLDCKCSFIPFIHFSLRHIGD
ncbi:MAG: hypothetical protein PHT94_00645 [Candidatus Nanoarchaeia archaeon]|nr:hypothetical protein [Candidatus Nanoarchaeia archaeon]